MRDRQTCIECGKQSPETETNYTLISAQFGWRLTRRRTDKGEFVIEWRCPDCWRNHKKKQDDAAAPPSVSSQAAASGAERPPPSVGKPSRTSRPPPRGSSKPPAAGPAGAGNVPPASRDARKRPPG